MNYLLFIIYLTNEVGLYIIDQQSKIIAVFED